MHYDTGFYDSLLKKSKSIFDLNSNNKRAKDQKIYLDMKNYSDLIDELINKDLKGLK